MNASAHRSRIGHEIARRRSYGRAYALAPEWIEQLTAQALSEAAADGITGSDATPYLLRRVSELSHGKTLRSNVELVLNNARLGAQIAAALNRLEQAARCRD